MSQDDDRLPILQDVDSEEKELPPSYSEVDQNAIPQQSSVESTDLPELKVYTRRWYILFLFCVLACQQCLVWNTFGPIESAVVYAYSWTNSTVPMFANWGTIMFVLSVVPLSKLVEYNIRTTVVLVSGFVALGTVLRCCRLLTHNPMVFLVSCHLCAILNGISGVTICAAPPLLSSQWFAPTERTTATSINLAFNMLGNGLAMVVGPALVPYNPNNSTNNSTNNPIQSNLFNSVPNATNSTVSQDDVRDYIDTYMQIQAGVSVVLFFLICIYFPAKPPLPPAPSSTIQRTKYLTGLKSLLTNRDVLCLCFAYSLSQGVMGVWLTVLVNNFHPLGISDEQIGYMGLASVIAQCCLSMGFGYLSDRLKHFMKITILGLLTCATGGFVWLMLICLKVVDFSIVTLYAAVILATSINFSTVPLLFEMSVEIAYPVNESLVGGFLTAAGNFVGILFLLIFFIPNIGFVWIDYLLVASTLFAIPAVLLTKETHNRSNLDEVAINRDISSDSD